MTFYEWRRTQDEFCDDPACRASWCHCQLDGWEASAEKERTRCAPLVKACEELRPYIIVDDQLSDSLKARVQTFDDALKAVKDDR